MKTSGFFIATQKEVPAEAEIVSHRLMLRASLIRRLAAGIYTWLPLGTRIVRKVEQIIREEMNRAGAIELVMPVVQPSELWQESGRWKEYGPELLRFKDRHERDFVIQPTSEEVITDLARSELKSYRRLPVHFYQIQTKFRDERRPRFGVMRGREFVMKDGYSFHASYDDLQREYRVMHDTYTRIFSRLGLKFRAVAADTGSIGGTGSHEFHVLADSGEDAIAFCPQSDYAANVELAEALAPGTRGAPKEEMRKVPTPGKRTCEDVAALLKIDLKKTVKSIAVMQGDEFYLLLVRGDHSLNEIKTQKQIGTFRFAGEKEVESHLGKAGYIGPVGKNVKIVADRRVALMSDFVCGANEEGFHLTGVNWGRDLPEPQVADIRNVVDGDPSPDGKGKLEIVRGIVFPAPIAPFTVSLVPIGYRKSAEVRAATDKLYAELQAANVDVLLDDRDERPGVLFADMDLIGIPHRIVLSERLAGKAEYKGRRDEKAIEVPLAEIVPLLLKKLE